MASLFLPPLFFFCLFQYCRLQIHKFKTFIHVFSKHWLLALRQGLCQTQDTKRLAIWTDIWISTGSTMLEMLWLKYSRHLGEQRREWLILKPKETGEDFIEKVFPSQQGNQGHAGGRMHVCAERIRVKSYNMLEELQKSFTWP